jgi:hypothetical protein
MLDDQGQYQGNRKALQADIKLRCQARGGRSPRAWWRNRVLKAAAAHCTHHGGASIPRASGTRQNQSPVKYPCICYAHKFGCNNKEREHTDVDWKRSKLKNHRPRHAVRPSVACPRHSSIHMHSRLGNNSKLVSSPPSIRTSD